MAELRAHGRLALWTTAGLVPLLVWLQPGLLGQTLILLPGFLAVGIPHGGLDHLVAGRIASAGRLRLLPFVFRYLALAACFGAVWCVFPDVALVALVALSIIHFGQGDVRAESGTWERRFEILARGGLPILLPIAAHPVEVEAVFAWILTEGLAPGTLNNVAPWLALAWLAVLVGWLGVRSQRSSALSPAVLEIGVLTASAVLLPPLLSFGIYFCVWHSTRHLLVAAGWLDARGRAGDRLAQALRRGLPMSFFASCGLGLFFLLQPPDLPASGALWRALFLVLLALTVPHMIVTWKALERLGVPTNRALGQGRIHLRVRTENCGDRGGSWTPPRAP